jgi:hypothetical protein
MKIAGIECPTMTRTIERMEVSGPRNQIIAIQNNLMALGWTVVLSLGSPDHKDQFLICVEREISPPSRSPIQSDPSPRESDPPRQ